MRPPTPRFFWIDFRSPTHTLVTANGARQASHAQHLNTARVCVSQHAQSLLQAIIDRQHSDSRSLLFCNLYHCCSFSHTRKHRTGASRTASQAVHNGDRRIWSQREPVLVISALHAIFWGFSAFPMILRWLHSNQITAQRLLRSTQLQRPALTVSTNFRQPGVNKLSAYFHKQLFCWFSRLKRHQASVPNNNCLSASLVIAYYSNVYCVYLPGVLSPNSIADARAYFPTPIAFLSLQWRIDQLMQKRKAFPFQPALKSTLTENLSFPGTGTLSQICNPPQKSLHATQMWQCPPPPPPPPLTGQANAEPLF